MSKRTKAFTLNNSREDDRVSFSCKVKRVIFRNTENGFYVFLVTLLNNHKDFNVSVRGAELKGRDVVITGNMIDGLDKVIEGDCFRVIGEYTINNKTGKVQVAVNVLRDEIPQDVTAIRLFLKSGKIAGIGYVLADRIVDKFGEDTIQVISDEPEKLLDVEGIGEVKKNEIIKGWNEWKAIYNLLSDLSRYDISDKIALKIFDRYGADAVDVIQNNPYQLREIEGLSFKEVDKIALKSGVGENDAIRVEGGILYTVSALVSLGSTAIPYNTVIDHAAKLLQLSKEVINQGVDKLIDSGQLVSDVVCIKGGEEDVYVKCLASVGLYEQESYISFKLKKLNERNKWLKSDYAQHIYEKFLRNNKSPISQDQLRAVKSALNNKVTILTGRPGSGKTRTINAILSAISLVDMRFFYTSNEDARVDETEGKKEVKVALAAPTGRAAKRMSESTGFKATTIHSLLGASGDEFEYNSSNYLPHDVVIIDEMSMVDTTLMSHLLEALKNSAVLIMVGDTDQLPSVGAGKVLYDIIDSGVVKTINLTEIHRQGEHSNIVVAANQIVEGKAVQFHDYNSKSDFVFIKKDDDSILDTIIHVINDIKQNDSVSIFDIQVLTPKRKDALSVQSLNEVLRGIMNENYSTALNGNKYQIGDKIMQNVNDKEKNINNGDLGVVLEYLTDSEGILASFDDEKVKITKDEFKKNELAYAKTIHKSQGSEYQYVIVPMTSKHQFMWDRKLLYTALTRGKKRAIFIGDINVFNKAIRENKQAQRITYLSQMLREENYSHKESEAVKTYRLSNESFGSMFLSSANGYMYEEDEPVTEGIDGFADASTGTAVVNRTKGKTMAFGFN